ncbi:MAG: hypothetical protein U0175_26430 [Caldilineaceae bacterium]
MAAWDRFLLIWAGLFFVPMILLFADLFYREVVRKAIPANKVTMESSALRMAESKVL